MAKHNDWDFITSGKVQQPSRPITLTDSENEFQRFERFARCLSRCVMSCSLCKAGTQWVQCENNNQYDPHCSNSFDYKTVALIKYQPNLSDYEYKLFNNTEYKAIFDKHNLSVKDFYVTSIIKCKDGSKECPFFDLELQSNFPSIVIVTDLESANILGVPYRIGEFITGYWGDKKARMYCTDGPDLHFDKFMKLYQLSINNPQIRNRLFQF